MSLEHRLNLTDPDGFYDELIQAQRDLSDSEAELMSARLLLILANHIGDRAVLREALQLARGRQD